MSQFDSLGVSAAVNIFLGLRKKFTELAAWFLSLGVAPELEARTAGTCNAVFVIYDVN